VYDLVISKVMIRTSLVNAISGQSAVAMQVSCPFCALLDDQLHTVVYRRREDSMHLLGFVSRLPIMEILSVFQGSGSPESGSPEFMCHSNLRSTT
jgi:hypothetical protein